MKILIFAVYLSYTITIWGRKRRDRICYLLSLFFSIIITFLSWNMVKVKIRFSLQWVWLWYFFLVNGIDVEASCSICAKIFKRLFMCTLWYFKFSSTLLLVTWIIPSWAMSLRTPHSRMSQQWASKSWFPEDSVEQSNCARSFMQFYMRERKFSILFKLFLLVLSHFCLIFFQKLELWKYMDCKSQIYVVYILTHNLCDYLVG